MNSSFDNQTESRTRSDRNFRAFTVIVYNSKINFDLIQGFMLTQQRQSISCKTEQKHFCCMQTTKAQSENTHKKMVLIAYVYSFFKHAYTAILWDLSS